MQQQPVLDKSTSMYIDLWPNPSTNHSDLNIYFKASALLKGEQKFHLLSVDSKQAITPKILSFSSLTLVALLPNILKCNSKPDKGMKPKQHDVIQHPTCLKLPNHITEDPDEAGKV
jgi:hypothetical protein